MTRRSGATVMPWKTGRVLVWDVTCPDTYAPSHISVVTREAGAVAAQAEQRKRLKYAELEASHHFVPVAIETSGVCGPETLQFLHELGIASRQKQGSLVPSNSSSRGPRSPFRGAARLLCWAQARPSTLTTTVNSIFVLHASAGSCAHFGANAWFSVCILL